jgi:SHS family lactate transporter-like MFS transporter
MTMMNFASHGTQDMYPTFLERHWHFGPAQRSVITGISMIGAILGGVVLGLVSDRIGRRRAMIAALIGGIVMVPLWAYAPSAALLALGAFLIQFMVQGAWGVIPAHLSELSPDSVRGFMPGFAYQCGVLVASSVVYIEAVFAKRLSYATAMALTAVTVFALAAIVTGLGKERKGTVFGVDATDSVRGLVRKLPDPLHALRQRLQQRRSPARGRVRRRLLIGLLIGLG